MTDDELLRLYNRRCTAWAAMDMTGSGGDRWNIYENSTCYRAANAAIRAELIARGKPANLPGVTLHLTADRLNFVALKPGTMIPKAWGELRTESDRCLARDIKNHLYDYRGTRSTTKARRAGVSA